MVSIRDMAPRGMLALLCSAGSLLASCTTTASNTSRLTAPDIIEAGVIIRQSLAEAPLLAARRPDSPPMRLGLAEAVNKSNDRLAASDRWALTALVVYDRSVQDLLAQRNVQLYLPEETESTLHRMGLKPGERLPPADGSPLGNDHLRPEFRVTREPPTHILRAEVRSIARQGSAASMAPSDHRLDVYLIDYRITEFGSSAVLWAKTVELARKADGTVVD